MKLVSFGHLFLTSNALEKKIFIYIYIYKFTSANCLLAVARVIVLQRFCSAVYLLSFCKLPYSAKFTIQIKTRFTEVLIYQNKQAFLKVISMPNHCLQT